MTGGNMNKYRILRQSANSSELTHRKSVGETHWNCSTGDSIIKQLIMRRSKMQIDRYSFSAIMIKNTSLFRSVRSGQKVQGIASANSDALPCLALPCLALPCLARASCSLKTFRRQFKFFHKNDRGSPVCSVPGFCGLFAFIHFCANNGGALHKADI